MTAEVNWIDNGRLVRRCPLAAGPAVDEETALLGGGMVRVVTGKLGTVIRWSVMSPCFSSLFYVAEWLMDLPAPYMLRYFLCGWFEERFESAGAVNCRILEIVMRGDVHLMQRVFVREFPPSSTMMTPLLREVWMDGNAQPDYSVDCIYEESSGRFRVERIGPKSTIARLWGMAPVSYPCVNGGSYDRTVGAAYGEVLRQGRPRYDHVYAAMKTTDGTTMWIPYQRVVIPRHRSGAGRSVTVVTEIGKVDIQIV
ncbi:MAG: hypothetical protein HY245_02680 [Rhizobiales bacterium]|nr:hypothetical protein [Hyphomicrobiales bacterium]MBI3672332.1 hypothetical protein [Hyphomicrobiales bacterium]